MSKETRGPLEIFRAIQQGSLKPKHLSAESRRACMEHFVGDGYSMGYVADVFKVSLRTAQRDLAQIREEHSVSATPEVQKQLLGQLMLQASHSGSKLMRIACDKAAPHSAQAEAAYNAWRVQKELIEILQRLGIMPMVPQQVQADIHHVVQAVPSVLEMMGEVAILEKACTGENAPLELRASLEVIKGQLAQASAAEAIKDLKGKEKEAGA